MNAAPIVSPSIVGTYLEAKAKLGMTIYYSELVDHFGLPPLGANFSANPLCLIFEEIDREDAHAKRPFRTSVVIAKRSDKSGEMPGNGFFEALERLKGISDPRNEQARKILWFSELNATHLYPWP